jgi:hypothetical protein
MFADYADFFPGQYWSTALESAFHCNVDFANSHKYCLFDPQDERFAAISLTIANNNITRMTFSLAQNTIKSGDLAALWGKPEVQIIGYIAYLDWRDPKIKAVARIEDRRFDYFLPVSSVIFY